jgi:hypothetical protein
MGFQEPLFLVVSENAGRDLFRSQLGIEGFRFDPAPLRGRWEPGLGPIVLVKLHERPLAELVDDLSAWTSPDAFNRREPDGSVPAQEYLRAVIRAARDRVDDPFLDPFRRVVADPEWQGMLAIDPPLAADGLPLQVQGLAGGLSAPLRAHHVGVEIAELRLDALLANHHGTAFGLIRCPPPAPRLRDESPPSRDYEVRELDVLFADSEVASFSARVLLTVRDILHRPLELRGALWRPDGRPVFTVDLAETALDEISGVTISRAAFTTLSRTVFAESGRTELRARFALEATLPFAPAAEEIDIDVRFGLPGGEAPPVDRRLTLAPALVAAIR